MVDKTLSSIVGGGLRPPTTLFGARVQSASGVHTGVNTFMGATLSSEVTSATLTQVVSLVGPGVVTFLGMVKTSVDTTASKIRVIVDGEEALLENTAGVLDATHYYSIIGDFSTLDHVAEPQIPFESTFVVEVAGDGTQGSKAAYKRYLT